MRTSVEKMLTDAELIVLDQLLEGLANREIARETGLSDKTVKNHISHILRKTGTRSRLELTVVVYRARTRALKRELLEALGRRPARRRKALRAA